MQEVLNVIRPRFDVVIPLLHYFNRSSPRDVLPRVKKCNLLDVYCGSVVDALDRNIPAWGQTRCIGGDQQATTELCILL